jgi:hypothetical protein
MKLFLVKGADKIVISAKETDEGVVKQEKAPFKHINLLGCISFTGIAIFYGNFCQHCF